MSDFVGSNNITGIFSKVYNNLESMSGSLSICKFHKAGDTEDLIRFYKNNHLKFEVGRFMYRISKKYNTYTMAEAFNLVGKRIIQIWSPGVAVVQSVFETDYGSVAINIGRSVEIFHGVSREYIYPEELMLNYTDEQGNILGVLKPMKTKNNTKDSDYNTNLPILRDTGLGGLLI